MAFDAFIKIDSIPGESTDSAHTDWIEVLSFDSGVSQPSGGGASTGGARSGQRCDHRDFSLTKYLDKATPKLALHCCDGTHIPNIEFQLCRATGEKQLYMKVVMTDVLVSSASVGGSSSSDHPLPTESISLNYGKIEWTYTETDHKTGKPKGDVASHWDVTQNRGG